MDWAVLEEADWYFRKMVRRFIKQRDKISIEGISLPGILILSKMNRDGEQRLGDLAEQFDLTSGGVTGISDKLEKSGFAVRRRLEEDRRTIMLGITDKGRTLLHHNKNIGDGCISLLFDGFSIEELNQQIKYYKRIVDNLEYFSETILKLIEENINNEHQSSSVNPQSDNRDKKYITY